MTTAAAATAATSAATPATVSVVAVGLGPLALRAEIAEFTGEFGVEAVFEADLLDVGGA